MSDEVQIRISQYGAVGDATVTREQLMDSEQLTELAKELHREAVWACLKRLGADAALSWRQILANLETAREQTLAGVMRAPVPREMSIPDSAALSLATLDGLE